jgi:hypothetical protein
MGAHRQRMTALQFHRAGLGAELIFIKTPGLLMADKLATKENGHAYGNPERLCQVCKYGGGAAAAA